jgi:predicted NBD/HSP70 family sugar kinase
MKRLSFKSQIMQHLFYRGQSSCSELSEKLDKSLPFVNGLLAELVDAQYVFEKGLAGSTGGRRPITYSIPDNLLYMVAVSMDQRYTRIAIIDMHRNIVGQVSQFEIPLKDNALALPKLTECISDIVKHCGVEKNKLIGVGIGMPGFINIRNGTNYTFINFEEINIPEYIYTQTGLPVVIDNDSSVIALAELKFGAAAGSSNAMVININWGVGLGMVVKGELYRGEKGFAGEFSHIPLFNNNKLCSCGKSGCLETEASMLVIVEKAIAGVKSGRITGLSDITSGDYDVASREIMAAAGRGDQFSIELLSEVGYHIGRGVAILVHLFNPAIIVLSGRGAAAGKIWKAPIQQALNEHCIPRLVEGTVIEVSAIGSHAGILGAAALVMENLQMPGIQKKMFPDIEKTLSLS